MSRWDPFRKGDPRRNPEKSNASLLNDEQLKPQPSVSNHEKLPAEKLEAMVIIDSDLKQDTSDISQLIKEEIHDNLSEPTPPPYSRLSNVTKSKMKISKHILFFQMMKMARN